MDNQRSEKIMEEYREEVSDLRRQSYPKMSLNEAVKIASEYMLNHYSKEELKEAIINDKQMQLFGMEKSWLNALGKAKKMAKGSTVKGNWNMKMGTNGMSKEELIDVLRALGYSVKAENFKSLAEAENFKSLAKKENFEFNNGLWYRNDKYAKGSTVRKNASFLSDKEVSKFISQNKNNYPSKKDFVNELNETIGALNLFPSENKSQIAFYKKVKATLNSDNKYASGSTIEDHEASWVNACMKNHSKEECFIIILKDSQFSRYVGKPKNEYTHNRLPKKAIVTKDSVNLTTYTPNTGRYLDTIEFTDPTKLLKYLNKNQIMAKGSTIEGGVGDTIADRYARLTEKEAKRLDELSKKVRINEQTDAEDIEWDKLVHKYRGWEYKHAKGSTVEGELYRLYDVQDDNFKEIIGSLSQINDFLDEQGENGNYDKWVEGATFSNADKYGLYLEKIGKYAKGGIMSSGFNYSIGGL